MNSKLGRRSRLGFTLIEIMVVTSIFFMIVGMVTQILVNVMPKQQKLRDKTQRLREAATAAARLQREMRTSALVHWPAGNWASYKPDLQAANGPLMFVKNGPPEGWRSGNVVAYWHHPPTKSLHRTAYEGTGFTFGNSATYVTLPGEGIGGRVLARGINDLTLTRTVDGQAEYLSVEMEIEGVKDQLVTQFRLLPSPGL